jgi:hypothetical protein
MSNNILLLPLLTIINAIRTFPDIHTIHIIIGTPTEVLFITTEPQEEATIDTQPADPTSDGVPPSATVQRHAISLPALHRQNTRSPRRKERNGKNNLSLSVIYP